MENREIVVYAPAFDEAIVLKSNLPIEELENGELILSFAGKEGSKQKAISFDIGAVYYIGEF